MVMASLWMFFKLSNLAEICLDHKLPASHKSCHAVSRLTSTQSLHCFNHILKNTHYSRTPLKLRQCLVPLGSSGPVPFVLTYCEWTRIGAINSFVRYCSVVWSCVCLSSCGFPSIVSHSFSPFLSPNWPCLLKSLSASAAPAASDSVLHSREALSPRTKTHTYTHSVQCWDQSASMGRRGVA